MDTYLENNVDLWVMEVSFDNEVKQSFSGSKTRTITEVLVGVKQWMETKKKELCQTSQNATI